jgi:hypothetical protein
MIAGRDTLMWPDATSWSTADLCLHGLLPYFRIPSHEHFSAVTV